MKILILTIWCLVPLGLVAYHYGPGQQEMSLDATAATLQKAKESTTSQDWPAVISAYEQTLTKLPREHVAESRRIRLEMAKARLLNSELPKAREDLASLSEELAKDPKADPQVHNETLASLASSRYYMTYLMKLEGLPDSEWEPEIEAARQEQKLLVQRAKDSGDEIAAKKHADDLESAIRLERVDPKELYGQPIPKQCSGCCSGKCAGGKKPSNKPGQKPSDARGASAGAPLDGEGS